MDIKAGEEHVRSEARDWRERALKVQAENERLQKRNALLEDVAAAADGWRQTGKYGHQLRIWSALDKLREACDE